MTLPVRPVELLAPAGEKAAAYAAFAYGADAIYTGLPRFSARAEAVNLSAEDLEEVIAYAHSLPRPRRVYITLNTLVRNAERPDVIRCLALCSAANADAVIVQDAGVARLARTHFPSLRLHASTQMALHNIEGVRAAVRLGFSRVTLARELTLDEVRAIARDSSSEIEVFVHGALCYSYSGLCLYSALLRDRSGNRGCCAYPCRDGFQPAAGASATPPATAPPPSCASGLLFSMKDLATSSSIPDLVATGVASLKIEGRKKSPLYVAAAVNYYRKWLDQSFQPGEQERCANDLRIIFSRPWTSLYYQSFSRGDVVDTSASGHRGTPVGKVVRAGRNWIQFQTALPLEVHDGLQFEPPGQTRPQGFAVEEIVLPGGQRVFEAPAGSKVQVPLPSALPPIEPGTELFLASSQAVKRRYRFEMPNPREYRRRYPVDIRLTFSETRLEAIATAYASARTLQSSAAISGPFSAARRPETMQAALANAFSKLGDTPFTLRHLQPEGPPVFVPVSQLNTLRRQLAAGLEQNLHAAREHDIEQAIASLAATSSAPRQPPSSPAIAAWLLKTDQPTALLTSGPQGSAPPATEWIIELGRESVEQIETVLTQLPPGVDVRLALPMITRAWERERLMAPIRHFLDRGYRRWEIANLSGLDLLPPATEINLSADWPLYTLNSSAIEELLERGITRFTVSPEDTPENVRSLANAHPYALVWPVHADPPLFISESCPEAARRAHCPGPRSCRYTEERLVSKSGERVRVVNRNCRFFTLMDTPIRRSLPPGLPLVPRADFLIRPWSPGMIRAALERCQRTADDRVSSGA